MNEQQRLPGETVSLRGNEILPLTEPGACWSLESGSLGLFAVPLDRGVAVGPRRFFFGLGPGEALFAVGPVPEGQPAIVAVALEDCRLIRRPLEADAEAAGPGGERVDAWKASWRAAVGDLPDASPAKPRYLPVPRCSWPPTSWGGPAAFACAGPRAGARMRRAPTRST